MEKIVMRNIGAASVSPGEIRTVKVDRVMIHDIFIPFVVDKFREMGFTKVWDQDKVVLGPRCIPRCPGPAGRPGRNGP